MNKQFWFKTGAREIGNKIILEKVIKICTYSLSTNSPLDYYTCEPMGLHKLVFDTFEILEDKISFHEKDKILNTYNGKSKIKNINIHFFKEESQANEWFTLMKSLRTIT